MEQWVRSAPECVNFKRCSRGKDGPGTSPGPQQYLFSQETPSTPRYILVFTSCASGKWWQVFILLFSMQILNQINMANSTVSKVSCDFQVATLTPLPMPAWVWKHGVFGILIPIVIHNNEIVMNHYGMLCSEWEDILVRTYFFSFYICLMSDIR